MLVSLYAENIALIKKLNIFIGNGFTVLTGETGGGKSIIIDSLSLICGGRSDKSIIRTGEEYATVEAVFDISDSNIGEFSEYAEDGNITVYRKITADGRNVCKVNGRTVTVTTLRFLVSKLLNIHGQQDTQLLSDPAEHLSLLDSYAGTGKEFEEYSAEYTVWQGLSEEVERLKKMSDDRFARLDMIDFRINEIESAKIRVGEEEELESEKKVLANYEKILENVKSSLSSLDTAIDRVFRAEDSVSRLKGVLPEAESHITRLESCSCELKDIEEILRGSISIECDSPDKRIDEIEERLVTISHLERKYHTDEAGLAEKLEALKKEKSELDTSGELLEDKTSELKESEKRLFAAAKKLSEKRKKSAKTLEAAIETHLADLDMPSVTFVTEFSEVAPNEKGTDSAEFLISANAGEEPRPIARIASGGELSRIMLSVKSAFAEIDGVRTVVFDEIDTGISGKTSEKLGRKLKALSSLGIQILCVTHSAQIACLADTHYRVSKSEEGGRTYTKVAELDFDGRVEEISRIMGGINVTDAIIAASKELLSQGGAVK